ncbi:MAG: hypothetical protein IBX55_00305 [Methyloprofundus sp.]|nr:hypothetical protein [Methyloprofundus sp.]
MKIQGYDLSFIDKFLLSKFMSQNQFQYLIEMASKGDEKCILKLGYIQSRIEGVPINFSQTLPQNPIAHLRYKTDHSTFFITEKDVEEPTEYKSEPTDHQCCAYGLSVFNNDFDSAVYGPIPLGNLIKNGALLDTSFKPIKLEVKQYG